MKFGDLGWPHFELNAAELYAVELQLEKSEGF